MLNWPLSCFKKAAQYSSYHKPIHGSQVMPVKLSDENGVLINAFQTMVRHNFPLYFHLSLGPIQPNFWPGMAVLLVC